MPQQEDVKQPSIGNDKQDKQDDLAGKNKKTEFDPHVIEPASRLLLLLVLLFVGWAKISNPDKQELFRGLVALSIVSVTLFFVMCPPIPQPLSYHNLADQRCCCFIGGCCGGGAVPNSFDVLSNIPFAMVSFLGLCHLLLSSSLDLTTTFLHDTSDDVETLPLQRWIPPPVFARPETERILWFVYYIAIGLVSIGSSYYHLKPSNQRLAWDRLPMTIAFVSLTITVLQETTTTAYKDDHDDVSIWTLVMALLVGAGTVLYWRLVDDLRPYALLQLGAMVSIPIFHGLFGSQYYKDDNHLIHYVIALALYVVAKITESNDYQIYVWTGHRISGHTIKHLLSSVASGWAMVILSCRSLKEGDDTV